MTDREKAIVMAYTGCTILAGDKLDIYYKYVQEKLGRCVMTHELAYQEVQDTIEEAAREDFIAIAKTDNGWISVKDRLPNCNGIYLVWRPHYYGGEIGESVVCYFDGQNTWHDSYGVDFKRILHPDDVTHWRPLPEPPEEV